MDETLVVTVRKQESEVVVEVIGNIDLKTVQVLVDPLAESVKAALVESSIAALTVDLRQVDFIDSAGLALLVDTRKRIAPLGRILQIFVTKNKQPDRVLCVGRFDKIMVLKHDLDE